MNTSIKLRAVADNSNAKEVKETIKEKEATVKSDINEAEAKKLLEEVLRIKEYCKPDIQNAYGAIEGICNDMLEQLRLIIYSGDVKTTTKQRLNYMLSYSKKLSKGSRPILSSFHTEEDGSQTFTDGYFLVRLRGNDRVEFNKFEDLFKPDTTYPNTDKIIPTTFTDSYKMNVKELLKNIKLYKTIAFKLNDDYSFIDSDLLKKALIFSNAFGDIELKFNGIYKPVIFESNTGSTGVVLPMHYDGDINSDKILKVEKK